MGNGNSGKTFDFEASANGNISVAHLDVDAGTDYTVHTIEGVGTVTEGTQTAALFTVVTATRSVFRVTLKGCRDLAAIA